MKRKLSKKIVANEKIKPISLKTEHSAADVIAETATAETKISAAETAVSRCDCKNSGDETVAERDCEIAVSDCGTVVSDCENLTTATKFTEKMTGKQAEEIIADKSPELSERKNHGKLRSLDFGKCVFAYVLGGLVGTIWETVLNLCKGKGFVYCNGSIFTPINFVYGFGALIIWIFLANSNRKPYVTYLYGMIGGGIVEYLLSFLEEMILGARSWDYSTEFLNINGRTTIPFMLFWGLLCLAVVYCVYNPLAKIYDKCPKKVMTTIAIVMLAIVVADLTITVTALARYSARQQGIVSKTDLGKFLDRVFNDDYMKLHFPNQKMTPADAGALMFFSPKFVGYMSF